jgi:hypothetical protein
MALDANVRRRWFGAIAVLAALAMVIGGETVLRDRLGPFATLIYWLVCLILTGVAVMMAFLDVRALGQRTRQEQRALFEATLKKIKSDVEARPQPPGRNRDGPG